MAAGQADAAATLLRDWDDLVAFYDFPAEHHIHLRTCNVVESIFAGYASHDGGEAGPRERERALLVFKIVDASLATRASSTAEPRS